MPYGHGPGGGGRRRRRGGVRSKRRSVGCKVHVAVQRRRVVRGLRVLPVCVHGQGPSVSASTSVVHHPAFRPCPYTCGPAAAYQTPARARKKTVTVSSSPSPFEADVQWSGAALVACSTASGGGAAQRPHSARLRRVAAPAYRARTAAMQVLPRNGCWQHCLVWGEGTLACTARRGPVTAAARASCASSAPPCHSQPAAAAAPGMQRSPWHPLTQTAAPNKPARRENADSTPLHDVLRVPHERYHSPNCSKVDTAAVESTSIQIQVDVIIG